MISGSQARVMTSANTFFYNDPTGLQEKTHLIKEALSKNLSCLNDVLHGNTVLIKIPGYMNRRVDVYKFNFDDKNQRIRALEVAQKIEKALNEGKIVLIQLYHDNSVEVDGYDWFSATFGVVADTIDNVKTKFKDYDITKDELHIKIDDKLTFFLDDMDVFYGS